MDLIGLSQSLNQCCHHQCQPFVIFQGAFIMFFFLCLQLFIYFIKFFVLEAWLCQRKSQVICLYSLCFVVNIIIIPHFSLTITHYFHPSTIRFLVIRKKTDLGFLIDLQQSIGTHRIPLSYLILSYFPLSILFSCLILCGKHPIEPVSKNTLILQL